MIILASVADDHFSFQEAKVLPVLRRSLRIEERESLGDRLALRQRMLQSQIASEALAS